MLSDSYNIFTNLKHMLWMFYMRIDKTLSVIQKNRQIFNSLEMGEV